MLPLFFFLAIVSVLLYSYYKNLFSYWDKRNVPHLEHRIPLGDMTIQLAREPLITQLSKIYNTFKQRGHKHGGFFLIVKPVYMPVDPEYVRNVMVKDSIQHFNGHGLYCNEKEIFSESIFALEEEKWKILRQKLTPSFTSGKIKTMFYTMLNCVNSLVQVIEDMSARNEVMDAKDIMKRFTVDVIGSCAFGIEFNSFKNPDPEVLKNTKLVLAESRLRFLKGVFMFTFRRMSKMLGLNLIPKEASISFTRLAMDTYNFRKKNGVKRNDFMQLLMDLKEQGSNEGDEALTLKELIAQVFSFVLSGIDTASSTLSFCLFELSQNTDIQDKLRTEIKEVLNKHDGKITYASLQEMIYMDQVINETLRKYPVLPFTVRVCTESYRVPSTDATIDKGTLVNIPLWCLHRDPELFPDPEKFDPERFSEENKHKIIPGSYMPFGDGPKLCIASRFGLMELKMCLTALVKDFEFRLDPKTKTPLELDFGGLTKIKGHIWINLRKVSNNRK